MFQRQSKWIVKGRKLSTKLSLESLEERVVLDVGDTLGTAMATGLGPRSGSYVMPTERLGDGPFGARDVDMFQFQAASQSRFEARTSLPPGGVSMDTIIRLFNANGQELTFNDDCEGSFYSCIGFTFATAGNYYVGISGYSNFDYNPNQGGSGSEGSTGDFRLTLNLVSPPPGPIIEALTPARSAGPLSSVRVRFDRAINPASFTTADVNGFSGPIGDIAVQGITPVAGNREFDITFAQQVITGFYTIDLGPNILDTNGNAMDQFQDDNPGQFDDRFIGTFGIGGPVVVDIQVQGNAENAITGIRYTFDRAMDAASIMPEILSVYGPGGGALAVSSFEAVGPTGRIFEARLASPSAALGSYRADLFAGARDLWNNPLDQNGNFLGGEIPGDNVIYDFTQYPPRCFAQDAFGYLGCYGEAESIDLRPGDPGVFVIISGGDDVAASVNLGQNTFNFYGTTFTGNNQLFVSSNGLITFGAANTAFTNTNLTDVPLERAIAVLWDDWIGDDNSNMVLGRFDGNRLIIEWNDVRHFGAGPGTVMFQAILQLNTGGVAGEVRGNYVDVIQGEADFDYGASATMGIKSVGIQGGNRVLYSFNAASISDGYYLSYRVPAAAPSAGSDGSAVLAALDVEQEEPAAFLEQTSDKDLLDAVDGVFVDFGTDLSQAVDTVDAVDHSSTVDAVDALFDLSLARF